MDHFDETPWGLVPIVDDTSPALPPLIKGATKYDSDKPKMWLLPFISLYEVAKVMTFGAKKYAPDGWKSVPDGYDRYMSALLRHLTAIQEEGPKSIDEESGLLHISHVGCNSLFLIWYVLKGKC